MHLLVASAPKKPTLLKLFKQGAHELFLAQPAWNTHSVKHSQFFTHQQIKHFYHFTDSQYQFLLKKSAVLNISLLSLIESRLDVLLFRLHFASSIFEARNLISRGSVSVNGNICLTPHRILHVGSEISIDPAKAVQSQLLFKTCQFQPLPDYIIRTSINRALLVRIPSIESILLPLNLKLNLIPGAI